MRTHPNPAGLAGQRHQQRWQEIGPVDHGPGPRAWSNFARPTDDHGNGDPGFIQVPLCQWPLCTVI